MGFHPSELFSSSGIGTPFQASPPLLRFLSKPFDLEPALQRVTPRKKPSLEAARRIRSDLGLGSLGRSRTPRALPPKLPTSRASPSQRAPLTLTEARSFDHTPDEPRGIRTIPARHLPPKRAPTRTAFRTDCLRDPFEDQPPADYFFISRSRPSCDGRELSLCGRPLSA
jgi:hypothetical protein